MLATSKNKLTMSILGRLRAKGAPQGNSEVPSLYSGMDDEDATDDDELDPEKPGYKGGPVPGGEGEAIDQNQESTPVSREKKRKLKRQSPGSIFPGSDEAT